MDGLPSSELQVHAYSLIMMWPLSVRPQGDKNNNKTSNEIINAIKQAIDDDHRWKRIENKLHHLRPAGAINTPNDAPSTDEYAEFVYFYPFVQQFLFGKSPKEQTLSIYRFTGVDEIEVELNINKKPSAAILEVPRLNLYVFGTGDVMLVSEVTTTKDGKDAWDGEMTPCPYQRVRRRLKLSEVLQLNETLRRTYPPYFESQNKPGDESQNKPGYAIKHAVWRHKGEVADWSVPKEGEDDWAALSQALSDKGGARNPLYLRWRALLPQFSSKSPYQWRQVQDDRMPAMTSVVLEDPAKLEEGDWVRLANFDGPGEGLPYAKKFLETFEADCCYDRFWDPNDDGRRTRYLTTGFGFAQVLKKDGGFWKVLHRHCRTLYFQMALISHFHQAALQNLSDQMALVAQKENLEGDHQELLDYRENIKQIMARIIQFTQIYWFTDVSNQIQARELFALLRKHLGLEALFAQVTAEARETNAFLNRLEDERTAKATENFNRIAMAGTVLGVTVGAMGMNMLIPGQTYDWHVLYAWAHGGFILGITVTAMILMTLALGKLPLNASRAWIPLGFAVVFTLGMGIFINNQIIQPKDEKSCTCEEPTTPEKTQR